MTLNMIRRKLAGIRPLWRPVFVLTILSVATRACFFTQPLQPDEAATYTRYCLSGDHPVSRAFTHYMGPNNHVLHSLMFTTLHALTGWGFPLLRLPAFLPGVLAVPLAYIVLRRMIGRSGALLAALMLCASGFAIQYSADARGYALGLFLGLVIVQLAWQAVRRRDVRRVVAAGILSGLAVYTVTTNVQLVVAVAFWLFIARPARCRVGFGRFLTAGIYTSVSIFTTIALHARIMLFMGPRALWNHPCLAPMTPAELLDSLPFALSQYGKMLADGILPVTAFLCLLALGAFHLTRRRCRAASMLLTLMLVPLPLVFILRRIPCDRTMTYLLPYAAALAAMGATALFRRWPASTNVVPGIRRPVPTPYLMLLAIITVFATATYVARWPFVRSGVPDLTPVARYLAERPGPTLPVLARTGVCEPLQYHLHHLDAPFDHVVTPKPEDRAARGLLVRQLGQSMGSKLPEVLHSMRLGQVVFENESFQVVRVFAIDKVIAVRPESPDD